MTCPRGRGCRCRGYLASGWKHRFKVLVERIWSEDERRRLRVAADAAMLDERRGK